MRLFKFSILFFLFVSFFYLHVLARVQYLDSYPSPQDKMKTQEFQFEVGAAFGDRDIFDFIVKKEGTITVEASWTGDTPQLALILNGPTRSEFARSDGLSPLKVSHDVNQKILNKGTSWKVSIVNFSRRGSARGTVKVTYLEEKRITPLIKLIPKKEEKKRKTIKPYTKVTGVKSKPVSTRVKAKPKIYVSDINLKAKYPIKRNYAAAKQLQFVQYRGAKPMTYAQFKLRFPVRGKLLASLIKPPEIRKIGLVFRRVYTPSLYPKGKVIIAVNSSLYPRVSSSLNTYIADIETQGYFGQIVKVSSTGTPWELRNYLQTVDDIAGVVLVGSLPVAWYETQNDFCPPNPDGTEAPPNCHGQWPCDLFFMDLDGVWSDRDVNGVYDSHTGNTEPEIFLGRLAAYTLDGNEADLINNYFAKNHRFRTGKGGFAARGMAFVDDDWSDWGKCGLEEHFDIVDDYIDHAYTNSDHYKENLRRRLTWMHLCCHSWPRGHRFYKNKGKDDAGFVFSKDIKDTNHPQAFFYNLFCCSSANFAARNYIAGWYTFGDSFGLCTVGSTKVGSMLYFEWFYGALNEGMTIGEALREWWKAIQPREWWRAIQPIDMEKLRWHYGMTVIGDPLLNWRVGAIPHGLQPADGSKIALPAEVTLRWNAITNFGPVSCKVEVQYWDVGERKWKFHWGAAMRQPLFRIPQGRSYLDVTWNRNKYRWRVKAHLLGQWGPWSPWQYVEPR